MLSKSTTSNLSEALIAVKKIEKNFIRREFTFLDRDRSKIRANVDRHMETFLQLTRKRHETWYRHDRHFREAVRKEKERHEKRKERQRQKLLMATNPDYIPRVQSPFQPAMAESIVLPLISTATKTSPASTPRGEPMTKIERRTQQVLRASQKLLDDSAARSRFKFVPGYTSILTSGVTTTSSSSCSFNSATIVVPMTTSIDSDEYNRLINESLQRETYSDFIDHFVRFRPEYREQFGLIHGATKRQEAIIKLREFNQIQAKIKDERFHQLIRSLTDYEQSSKKK